MSDFLFISYLKLLSFERPFFLFLVFQPLIFLFLKRMKVNSLSKYSEKLLWPWSINISEQYFKTQKVLSVMAWILIAVAVSGPRLPNLNKTLSESDKNIKSDVSIMVITDINGITETEFDSYLIKLNDFIDKLNGERIGFVALNSTSALISPLTNDYNVSHFYLKKMFDITNSKIKTHSNDLYKALTISNNEIASNKSTSSVIIYWSDYTRNKISNNQLLKTKILLEKLAVDKITVIPVWNDSNESDINSDDILSIFGNLSSEYIDLTFLEIYEKYLDDLKSTTLFDMSKNHSHQQLFSYPLIIGLILLLISFIPVQFIKSSRLSNVV
ncbi:hypothetical protein MNBD_GAMMA22-1767 [hydrothermal vent metagenome]|uniref:VWFA domain-containing protein n=1 Tax=hydrothermal vent metagenome TaxID=652676 RepID=A0A3B0ZTI2_9ZZZZ